MNKNYWKKLLIIILLLPSFYLNAQHFVQNDADRIRIHQIINTYGKAEIPLVKQQELNDFFSQNSISKPEAEKYEYLLRALFDKKISAEDWRFFYSFLLKSFSANEKFPTIILINLKK
jgi:hypothetical protein